jgi:hypothetical protein
MLGSDVLMAVRWQRLEVPTEADASQEDTASIFRVEDLN